MKNSQAGWTAIVATCALLVGLSTGGRAQTAAAPNGNAQGGETLYASKNCSQCHGMSGEGTAAGPKLSGSAATFANFLNQLRRPADKMPVVPASAVTDAQAADLYAFVRSLGTGTTAARAGAAAGNVENGKKIYTAYGCYECHGYAAQGGTGPRLAPNPIPLANVIRELRHPNSMPPYTEKVVSDAEIGDIYAFLQTIPQAPKVDSIPLLAK